jgi:hypothetical protein
MGVILSCLLLLITPCINAVEYNEVKEEVKNNYQISLKNELDIIRQKFNRYIYKNEKIENIMASVIILFIIYLVIGFFFGFCFFILELFIDDDLNFNELILYTIVVILLWPFLIIYLIIDFFSYIGPLKKRLL